MDIQALEKRIAQCCGKLSEDRSVKGRLLRDGVLCCFAPFIVLAIFRAGMEISWFWPLVIVAGTMPVAFFLAVKNCHYGVKGPSAKAANTEKSNGFDWSAIGAVAPVVGIILHRVLSENNPEAVPIVIILIVIFLTLICSFFAFSHFYFLYLLKKYCPYLDTLADRRYAKPPGEGAEPQE